ncbi:hypothetical protein B4U79_16042 [Dinothrombium tinctorium]|uniref:Uncharacterized protein n=1 Tax=Dinothrombium tinctorium TaxID=1965070 RepID=A0A443QR79_9ACAR|nr:hypothetical protein B4U79_16042 [Dinothrombium tinctorium]
MSLVVLLSFLSIASVAINVESKCDSGTDLTQYVSRILNEVNAKGSETLRLPRRLLGDIYLKRGFINNIGNLKLGQNPVFLVCHNETLGAVQAKFVAENVTFNYEWVFGDEECWGSATIPPQTIYIDFDIQQNDDSETPKLLGLYVSDFTNTKFDVRIEGGSSPKSEELLKHQVLLTTKTALLRDAELTMTMHFAPKVEKYLFLNNISN